jgi:hypothetical protein
LLFISNSNLSKSLIFSVLGFKVLLEIIGKNPLKLASQDPLILNDLLSQLVLP